MLLQTETVSNPMAFLLAMMVVMVVFSIRSNSKRRKEQESREESLKKGVSVVTAGGLHGVVHQVQPNTVVVTIDQDTRARLTINKSAVTQVIEKEKKKA